MALIQEYFDLTKKYRDEYGDKTVLYMQVGAFFEVYGFVGTDRDNMSPLSEFSQICELNIAPKHVQIQGRDVQLAGCKDVYVDKYIRKMQEADYTVVVYVQDENVKNTTRSLGGIFSPGTFFQPDTTQLTNSTACIWVDYVENCLLSKMKGKFVVVGVANIDIYTGKTTVFQFKETYINSPTTYDELERFISVHNPSETILISNVPDPKAIDHLISYANLTSSVIHKMDTQPDAFPALSESKWTKICRCEKQTYQMEILSQFYPQDNFHVLIQDFQENPVATQALCFLLDFIYQHNPQLVNKIALPEFEHSQRQLTLANHSLKQLNIINDGNVKSSKYSCVSQMLNNCLTPMGKRAFQHAILNPICDTETLNDEYNITEYVINRMDDGWGAFMKEHLTSIKDLSKFERQMVMKKIPPEAFYLLHQNLQHAQDIFGMVETDMEIMRYCHSREENIHQIPHFIQTIQDFIEEHIDLDISKDINQLQSFDVNFIKSEVDEELDEKLRQFRQAEQNLERIREYFNQLVERKERKTARNATNDSVKIYETEKNAYSVVCTNTRSNVIHSMLPDVDTPISLDVGDGHSFQFVVSKKTVSFEKQNKTNKSIHHPKIDECCRTISSTKHALRELTARVYGQMVENFVRFQPSLDKISRFITMIDMLWNKATIAKKHHYCRPTIDTQAPKSFVKACGLRHALIEQFLTSETYVENDLTIGDGETDGVLLYGTNAVGKTTFIRSLGVAVIMAQAGLFVPCSSFQYKPYRRIFTRIIGNDNIFKGLSTFEVEMSELRTILRMADENSLILGDELCSGTETVSAISIFVAGIQKLHESKCSFIFATHLHEIVDYDEIQSLRTVSLKHMEVSYNKELDLLVYDRKLKAGSGANVYGLEVCKSLHLPSDFLEMANEVRIRHQLERKASDRKEGDPELVGGLLSLKPSRYNAGKLVHICEKCGKNMGTEVHHLEHQSNADKDGFIGNVHKNHLANLMTLCEKCHTDIHKPRVKKVVQKRVKTSKGYKVLDMDIDTEPIHATETYYR